MKHLIIFSLIIIGVILLAFISWYDNKNKVIINNYSNIYLKKSKIGGKLGRGIFANKNFNKDEVIEKAPYIEDKISAFNGLIRDYIFGKNSNNAIVAFGYASLYNHSDTPNATWNITDDYLEIKSIKPIIKDTEIVISYGNNYWNTRKDIVEKSSDILTK
jgi:hypothetical protein